MTTKMIATDAVRIKPDARYRLKAIGFKGETYSDVIHRLVDEYLEAHPDQAKRIEATRT